MYSNVLETLIDFLLLCGEKDSKVNHIMKMYQANEIKLRASFEDNILKIHFYRVGDSIQFTFYEFSATTLPTELLQNLRTINTIVKYLHTHKNSNLLYTMESMSKIWGIEVSATSIDIIDMVRKNLKYPNTSWQVVSEGALLLENYGDKGLVEYFDIPLPSLDVFLEVEL